MNVSAPAHFPHQFSNHPDRYAYGPFDFNTMSHQMVQENALGLHTQSSSDSAYYSNGSSEKPHSNDSSVTPEPDTFDRHGRSLSKDSLRSSQSTSPSTGLHSIHEHKRRDSSSPKQSSDVGEDDDNKRSKFLKRNRVAASKCRQKKKQWVEQLTQMHDNLEATNGMLHQEFNAIKEQVSMVKNQLMSHASCKDANIDQWFKNEAARFVHAPNEPSVLPPMVPITPQFAAVPSAMPQHVMIPGPMHTPVHQHAIPHHPHPHPHSHLHSHHSGHVHPAPVIPEMVSMPGSMAVTLPQTIQPASLHFDPASTVCGPDGMPLMTTAPAPAPILEQSFSMPPQTLPPIMASMAPAPPMAAVSTVGMDVALQSAVTMDMGIPTSVAMDMPVSSVPMSMALPITAASPVDLAMNPVLAMNMAGPMTGYPQQKF